MKSPSPALLLDDSLKGILTVRWGDQTLAIVLRRDFRSDGLAFITPPTLPQQLAYMRHAKGHRIRAHEHPPSTRVVSGTLETLLVRSGRVRVDLFADANTPLTSLVLDVGDIILLISGGHGFEALEDLEMVEIKQGPYLAEGDKVKYPDTRG